jgi:DNA primase
VTVHLPTTEQRKFFEQAVSQYQSDLRTDIAGQAYLTSRGVSAAAAATFRLGVLRNPLLGHERYQGRLCIPYITPAGVVTMTFRCIQRHINVTSGAVESCGDHSHGKYLAPEGIDRTLYNVTDLKKVSQHILLVEGEMDALTWSMCGWPTVGIPGVENWKEHFSKCIDDYAEILAICDGDDAGYRLGTFLAREVRARVIRLPRGEDGNSLYVKGGRDALAGVLAGLD